MSQGGPFLPDSQYGVCVIDQQDLYAEYESFMNVSYVDINYETGEETRHPDAHNRMISRYATQGSPVPNRAKGVHPFTRGGHDEFQVDNHIVVKHASDGSTNVLGATITRYWNATGATPPGW